MRPAANARLLFWPALTAILVILVSQFAGRRDLDSRSLGLHGHSSRSIADRASDTGAPAPWTLSHERHFPKRIAPSRAELPEPPRRAKRRRLAEPTSKVVRGPQLHSEPPARVRLEAPVIDEREELAGIERRDGTLQGGYLSTLVQTVAARPTVTDSPRTPARGATTDAPIQGHYAGAGTPFGAPAVGGEVGPRGDDAVPAHSPRVAVLQRAESARGHHAWPATPSLDRLLKGLDDRRAAAWAEAVSVSLRRLQSQSRLATPGAGTALQHLSEQVREGMMAAEAHPERGAQRDWLRAVQALQRRVVVWSSVWHSVTHGEATPVSHRATVEAALPESIAAVRQLAQYTTDPEGWQRFLLIDEIESLFQADESEAVRGARQLIAHRLLSRLQWHLLTAPQREWLGRQPIRYLATGLKPWATRPVDYTALLQQIEWQESDPVNSANDKLAGAVQALRHADDAAGAVARSINDYYRNANLRIAISKEMLARLIPPPETRVQPVRNRILGADVRGTSSTDFELDFDLVPAEDRWHVRLLGNGTVKSVTNSEKGPVRLHHHSRAAFAAKADIVVDRHGATVSRPDVQVDSSESLRGLASDFDGLPLVGPLVRTIALERYQRDRSVARSITTRLIENNVTDQLESQLTEKLDAAEERVMQRLLGPLAQLKLQPLVVDIETTERRLAARYRFASSWQLAASSPRPRAPADSLMSIQLHQSAINNLLQQLAPTDEMTSFASIARRVADLFQLSSESLAAEVPEDMRIQFASKNPVVVKFDDDRVQLLLKVVRLARDGEDGLRFFVVKAEYRPVVDGGVLKLQRDGVLEIGGPRLRMGDRIAIRAVFNAILNNDRMIPLMDPSWLNDARLESIALTQVELRDGWLGVAFGDASSAGTAVAQQSGPPVR